jgi:hypothetical protein
MEVRVHRLFVFSLSVMATIGTMTLSSAQERQMGGFRITVFTDSNFRGKSATFRHILDLRPIGFTEAITSLKWASLGRRNCGKEYNSSNRRTGLQPHSKNPPRALNGRVTT